MYKNYSVSILTVPFPVYMHFKLIQWQKHQSLYSCKRANTWCSRPHCRSRSSDGSRSSCIQIVHVFSATHRAAVALAGHSTRLGSCERSWLRVRRDRSSITFAPIFDAGIEIRGCWLGGNTGQCGRDAELRCHAVVAEKFWHVVTSVWSSRGISKAAY